MSKKASKEQVAAALAMHGDPNNGAAPEPAGEQFDPTGGRLPGEELPVDVMQWERVDPETYGGRAWNWYAMQPGERIYCKLVRVMDETDVANDPEAENGQLHGSSNARVYVTDYKTGRGLILNGHYLLLAYFRDQQGSDRIHEVTLESVESRKGGGKFYAYSFRRSK